MKARTVLNFLHKDFLSMGKKLYVQNLVAHHMPQLSNHLPDIIVTFLYTNNHADSDLIFFNIEHECLSCFIDSQRDRDKMLSKIVF